VVDHLTTGFEAAVPPGVPMVRADIGARAAVADTLTRYGVDTICHFAGSIVAPESVADPIAYYANNTTKSLALIDTALAAGVERFVFASSAAVYGLSDAALVSEAAPIAPINPYGRSKHMTEAMLADVSAAHGLSVCALRYFNVAGADPLERTGQSTRGATNLVKVAVEAATGQRPHVDIFGDDYATPDGTGVRDYIHVSDLAEAHVAALDLLVAGPGRFVALNCGYGHGFSVNEVLDAVERITNRSLVRRTRPRRPGDPDAMVADNRAILASTGWRPRFDDLDIIVGHALQWERRLVNGADHAHNSFSAVK